MPLRFWLRMSVNEYTVSYDDLRFAGYIEVTERPAAFPHLWMWDLDTESWYLMAEPYSKQLTETRKEREYAGVIIDGRTYATDVYAQAFLESVLVYGAEEVDFKHADNTYEILTRAQLQAVFDRIMTYRLDCHASEKVIRSALATNEMTVEMLQLGWPSNVFDTTPTDPEETEKPAA